MRHQKYIIQGPVLPAIPSIDHRIAGRLSTSINTFLIYRFHQVKHKKEKRKKKLESTRQRVEYHGPEV